MTGSRTFYLFLGFHSFLIGLFPFFLPVYLVKNGHGLMDICWFIGLTGVGYCSCLMLWDQLRTRVSFLLILASSFITELLLLVMLTNGLHTTLLPLIALLNGVYCCLFWMLQRVFFYATTTSDNSGRKFGNFQIFVMVLLKIGIFIGGLLLEKVSVSALIMLSVLTVAIALYFFIKTSTMHLLPRDMQQTKPLAVRQITGFQDRYGSRLVFSIDGIFLYLESYFWLISLFYIVKQSFLQLGLLVIVLALAFSLLFYLIKNRIDSLPRQTVYSSAVLLYAFSWVLRGFVSDTLPENGVYILLILITFCTSFFRLAFNKRFFDIARASTGYNYIFYKSYYSQFFLAVFFLTFALVIQEMGAFEQMLRTTYLMAAGLTMLYLLYRFEAGGSVQKVKG